MRKSSSVSVPMSLLRSPSTIPSARSAPVPGTECILASIAARHENRAPSGPARHAPVSAFHALPLAHSPARAERRAHASSTGSRLRMAQNRTVRPRSGTVASEGQPTLTTPPSSGPPRKRTRTLGPKSPDTGSASTTPVHCRAPQSATQTCCRSHAHDCSADTEHPANRPAQTTSATEWMAAGRRARARHTTPSATVAADTAATPEPRRSGHTRCSVMTEPQHIATANHAMGGICGRSGCPLTRTSPGPSALRTSRPRCPRPA